MNTCIDKNDLLSYVQNVHKMYSLNLFTECILMNLIKYIYIRDTTD